MFPLFQKGGFLRPKTPILFEKEDLRLKTFLQSTSLHDGHERPAPLDIGGPGGIYPDDCFSDY